MTSRPSPPGESGPEPGRSSPAAGGAAGGDGAGTGAAGELPADLHECAVRLAKAVQRHGLYPEGHPALSPIVDDVLEGLGWILSSRERVTVGVSPDRLVHEEGESDPSHPLLSSLAERLHEHHVSRLTFLDEVDRDEIAGFLAEIAAVPESSDEALGARPEASDRWPHVLVEPVRYDTFSMAEEAGPEDEEPELEGEAEDLWLGLARSALADEELEELDEDETPGMESMVAALSEVTAHRARSRTVAARMVKLAQMLERGGAAGDPDLPVRERFLELIQRLDAATMGKLLSAASQEQRQAFLQATADWLPAGTVVELLEEVAESRNLDISYQMLRLLSKLASYAEVDGGSLDPEAGAAFREQVEHLVSGWRENIRSGGQGAGSVMDAAGPGTPVLPEQRSFVDPGRLLRTALEAGTLGPLGESAVRKMQEEGRSEELLELLRDAPDRGDAADALWELLDVPGAVRELLGRHPPDFEAVDALLERHGRAVAGPLLDALSESESRSVRRNLFSRLAAMEGSDIGGAILERLDDDRWFVQRNMLALLEERGEHPPGFTALPFTRHPRAEVRKEAYKLALRSPDDRTRALARALEDEDQRAVSLALAVLQDAPQEALDELAPRIRRRLAAGDLRPELARQAVRALGRAGTDEALEGLVELCRTRRMWRFWTVDLAEKSPVVLEALSALARGWHDHPDARPVLERARDADDPEVRQAARADPEAA